MTAGRASYLAWMKMKMKVVCLFSICFEWACQDF